MTRTEIAAMALQGLLAHEYRGNEANGFSNLAPAAAAPLAVEYADALLEELAKIPPPASIHESPKEGPPSGCAAGEAGGPQTRAADGAAKARRIAESVG